MNQPILTAIVVTALVTAVLVIGLLRLATKKAPELTDDAFAAVTEKFAQLAVQHEAQSRVDRLAVELSAARRTQALQQALAKASAALAPSASAPTT